MFMPSQPAAVWLQDRGQFDLQVLSPAAHLTDRGGADAPHIAAEAAEFRQHLDRRLRGAALLQVVADERLGGAIDVCTGAASLKRGCWNVTGAAALLGRCQACGDTASDRPA